MLFNFKFCIISKTLMSIINTNEYMKDHNNVVIYYKFTIWPTPRWLDSLVGRALHQYCTGHGFESCSGIFFSIKFHNCLSSVHNCNDQSCLLMSIINYTTGFLPQA